MSSFTSPLIVSPNFDGASWTLIEPFSYDVGEEGSGVTITVPKGFDTDFASIPTFLWFFPRWAKYNKSPTLHDWLYHCKEIMGQPITRKRADDIFLEAMLVEWRNHKSRCFVARIEYWGVRLFAWLAWR